VSIGNLWRCKRCETVQDTLEFVPQQRLCARCADPCGAKSPGSEGRVSYHVIVPWVPPEYQTEWHSPDRDFNPLNRGSHKTMGEAIDWARKHLNGTPYGVKEVRVGVDWAEDADRSSRTIQCPHGLVVAQGQDADGVQAVAPWPCTACTEGEFMAAMEEEERSHVAGTANYDG
jgi:hypothetical protein